ncbi:MAG: ElyC/SanA/YdcF family protein, partial [bacterium]|nr:ElyC/SanA/YdcF family protein [bacterium]
WVKRSTKDQIFDFFELQLTGKEVILVPGAGIYNQQPGAMYQQRLDMAWQLKQIFPHLRILISADNSYDDYDETRAGLRYLLERGIAAEDIFLDFAGFDTYDSIVRSREIFKVQKLIIVSQNFALPRAIFIANQLHIPAVGVSIGQLEVNSRNFWREKMANVKALFETSFALPSRFLGKEIPIDGQSNSLEHL